MKRFRQVLFWLHLAAGLTAGAAIGIMCLTGTTLAFESEIVAWAERDVRRFTPPSPDATRLPLQDLVKRAREARPDAPIASLVVSADPTVAIAFPLGREGALYANPYTGKIRAPSSTRVRDFMHLMTDWHRVLALDGDNRPIGKAINGACNLAFCVLALSGLYLWMPRTWSWRGVKSVALLNFKYTGKARDFNWHNVIGLWSAPVLIVLTLTAVPISFRWGGNLIYRLVGEEPPVQQGPGAASAALAVEITRPSPEARPIGHDAVVARVQQDFPKWETISLRSGNGPQRGAPRPAAGASAPIENRESKIKNSPQPLTVTIREAGSWPRTATTTLTLNPYTGEVLKREGYGDLSTARQIRSWTRFLHTGQALGWCGQFIAGFACLGGCFLVYTGFALSWRRFFGRKESTPLTSP